MVCTLLDKQAMTPEVEGDTPRGRRRREGRQRHTSRIRGLHSQQACLAESGIEGPRDGSCKRERPHAVAMGVGVVMTGRRLAERFTLVILLVLRMGGGVGIIEVRWRRMAE